VSNGLSDEVGFDGRGGITISGYGDFGLRSFGDIGVERKHLLSTLKRNNGG
jgi:hypothetical protein